MEPVTTTTCASCGAQVGPDEVAQGFAVKVSGRLMCPLCVDRLPGDAKVMVNQMRALKGMAATTYRFHSGRHPGLTLFTFTTAALVLNHRRKLAHGETFEALPLPPPGSRPRLPTATEAARGDRTGWIAVAGITILVITGVIWLAVPSGTPKAPTQAAPPTPVPQPQQTTTPRTPDPGYAAQIAALQQRLERDPAQAAAVADEAELLRDAIPPRELALRNRAAELARSARAAVPAPVAPVAPPAPPTPPEPVGPLPDETLSLFRKQPEPAPDAAQPPVAPVAPAPTTVAPVAPVAPAPTPVAQPDPTPAPAVIPKQPRKADPVVRWDARVLWPDRSLPITSTDRPIPAKDVQYWPWPWPSGEPIWAPAMDRKRKRLAIEMQFTIVGEGGGVALVVHPRQAKRSALTAVWTDGTTATEPLNISLDGNRWQTVLIPAAGVVQLDAARRRLRLEDAAELSDDKPFLVAGATMRADTAPQQDDCPPRLPLLDPAEIVAANGKPLRDSDLAALIRKVAAEPLKDKQFTIARAKILLPDVQAQRNAVFRATLRKELTALRKEARPGLEGVPNGNPADLPPRDAGFTDAKLGWPKDVLGDLDDYDAVVIGWGADTGDDAAGFGQMTEGLFAKFLTSQAKPRRRAVLPVLAIGAYEHAKPAEQGAIAERWNLLSRSLMSRGVPVIDLRHAQREASAELVREASARLIVDGLRQLNWLLRP